MVANGAKLAKSSRTPRDRVQAYNTKCSRHPRKFPCAPSLSIHDCILFYSHIAMPPFSMSRATTSDMPELAALMFRTFRPWTTSRFMGCFSEDDLPRFVEKYQQTMAEDITDIWIKVVDNDTGKIAAAANWKLYLGSEKAQERIRLQPPEWLNEEWKKESKWLLEPLNEAKITANPDPFLRQSV